MPKCERETKRTCPQCGRPLEAHGPALRCTAHGDFFSYGPNLLVRTPPAAETLPAAIAPWEQTNKAGVARR